MNGIQFALRNLKLGRVAGWAAGTEEDLQPYAERARFRQEVRLVEELSFAEQQLIANILRGATIGNSAVLDLPAPIVAELRRQDPNSEMVLALIEAGHAVRS